MCSGINQDINLNYNNLNCKSLLIYSCENNFVKIASKLIENENVDINLCEKFLGKTPLMIAIENKNIEIAKLLIHSKRIQLNRRSFKMETALSVTTYNNLPEIVELIIINQSFDPKESLLDYSFLMSINSPIDKKNNQNNITRKLIRLKDLDVNYLKNNCTALIKAVGCNDIELVDMIIQHPSFDPNKSQIRGAILIAIKRDCVEIFKKLLFFVNDDINVHLINDESLLVISSIAMSKNIVDEILKNQQFDPVKSRMKEAFEKLISQQISVEILEMIYKYDTSNCHLINLKRLLSNGKSFFTSISIKQNAGEVAVFLLKNGADPNYPDVFGVYPLQHAINISSLGFVCALINWEKPDIFRKITYTDLSTENHIRVTSTFLHLAAKSSIPGILQKILNLNLIDVNAVDSQGETPLIIAARYEKYENIKILFEREDLDYKHKNNSNEDALTILLHLKNYHISMNTLMTKKDYMDKLLSFDDKNSAQKGLHF